jgi:retron-type reverse transcriptase
MQNKILWYQIQQEPQLQQQGSRNSTNAVGTLSTMTITYSNLYSQLCSYDNLLLAFKKAKKRKARKPYVLEFEASLEANLKQFQWELQNETYLPTPLKTFIIREPKTRKISKSHFRDRIIHHAICNIIEPIFQKTFIYDSFANQKGKGTHLALRRFDYFKRKVSRNNFISCYVLKADVKHYFDTVDQNILIKIISKKIKDEKLISLIRKILENHKTKEKGKGMPLGNLTSQFFANVYLNELDYFVKHKLRAKYYIRYVDDFVILHKSKNKLRFYKNKIDEFLKLQLKIKLHPNKCKIKHVSCGASLLGFRVFYYHKLLRKSNFRKFQRKFSKLEDAHIAKAVNFTSLLNFLNGWLGYAMHANTYKLRCSILETYSKTKELYQK